MALYSDLILKLQATLAEDGTSVLIEDVTGTYPESPGGYAPVGTGTATRPEESQVNKFLMYQANPFLPENQNIPSTAITPPHTYGLVDSEGVPVSAIYQWVFMVTSVDGDTWDAILTNAYLTDDPWGYITQYFSDPDSGNPVQIGQKAVWANVSEINCLNNTRADMINDWIAGGCKECDTSSFMLKNAFVQGITSNLVLAEA